jgi:hypothetical protein
MPTQEALSHSPQLGNALRLLLPCVCTGDVFPHAPNPPPPSPAREGDAHLGAPPPPYGLGVRPPPPSFHSGDFPLALPAYGFGVRALASHAGVFLTSPYGFGVRSDGFHPGVAPPAFHAGVFPLRLPPHPGVLPPSPRHHSGVASPGPRVGKALSPNESTSWTLDEAERKERKELKLTCASLSEAQSSSEYAFSIRLEPEGEHSVLER